MIFGIAIMIIAFYWLMYETKRLTARLPYGRPPTIISIDELLQIAVCVTIIVYAVKYLNSLTQKSQLEETNAHTN